MIAQQCVLSVILVLASSVALSQSAQAFTFDSDVPQNIQDQMTSDLTFMTTVQGSSTTPLHKEIFGTMEGSKYKEWFEGRVKAVGMNGCGNGNAVACVIPFADPSKMWLTQNYIKFSHPAIARLMVVFHEARHTETQNGFWGHATCPRPFLDENGKDKVSIWTGAALAGQPACDSTPMGSYGSSTILLKNISKFCTNCNEKVKADAGIYADDQLGRITNADAKARMKADFQN